VLSHQPNVAWHGARVFGQRWGVVRVGQAFRADGCQQLLDLVQVEAGQLEVETKLLQVGKLHLQHFSVPTGVQRKSIVGNDISAFLGVGQVIEPDARHFAQAQLACSQHSTMSGNDPPPPRQSAPGW
jgi:hypothetical protein